MLFVMRLKSKVPIGTSPYLDLLQRVTSLVGNGGKGTSTPAGWYWQQPSHLQNDMAEMEVNR